MPRYFFNLMGDRPGLDEEGIELPDLGAAMRQAVQFASTIMQDHPDLVLKKNGMCIEVTDQIAMPLYMVTIWTSDVPAEGSVQATRTAVH